MSVSSGELAQDRDLGEVGADVIVQVARHAHPDPLDRQRGLQAVAVQTVSQRCGGDRHEREDAWPLPEGRKDRERDCCRACSDRPIIGYGANLKPVRPRRQARVNDRTLIRGRTPVPVDLSQPILVAKPSSGREVDSREVDLEGGRFGPDVNKVHAMGAELRQSLGVAADGDQVNASARRDHCLASAGSRRESLPSTEPGFPCRSRKEVSMTPRASPSSSRKC